MIRSEKFMILKKQLQDNPERHRWILSETPIEWPLLLDSVKLGYYNNVSVGSLTL